MMIIRVGLIESYPTVRIMMKVEYLGTISEYTQ